MKTGTITSFRRKWPTLIRQAQRTTRLKFERRPILKVQQRRGGFKSPAANEFRKRARHPHVYLTKKVVKKDPKLAVVCAQHELQEILYLQRGYSSRQAHLRAKKHEPAGTAWRLRAFCGYKKGDGIMV